MMDLGPNVKITEALAYADGSADRFGATLDMVGWHGVLIVVSSAVIAAGAVYKIKAQQDVVPGMSGAADLAGTGLVIGDDEDNKVHWIDLKPRERYVRLVVDKDAVNACAESALYIQYGPYGVSLPVTDVDGETHSGPAEGTA